MDKNELNTRKNRTDHQYTGADDTNKKIFPNAKVKTKRQHVGYVKLIQ